ncbi:MAG: radical SAM family heme chaperone HemW [Lachnospiraceae bacterium]|nr:radical SAM family heme chaperone HemW [Lachnospiraceae bacterium]
MSEDNKISLYIHIPFCIKKCNYCDFLSFPEGGRNTALMEQYFKALLREAKALEGGKLILDREREAETVVDINRQVRSIYIGGGTPNIIDAEKISEILCKLKNIFTVDEKTEISIELNPGVYGEDIIKRELTVLRAAGINRLSIGLQTADNGELKKLGRIHSFEDFLRLYGAARESGFENINIDLISGIPMQTVKSYERTLDKVLALKPEHISAYSLIIEEGTPFGEGDRESLKLPDEDEEYEIYLMTRRILNENGYDRYEISNYARKGYECVHNLACWDRKDYLGLGLGAASLMGAFRFSNTRELKRYLPAPADSRVEVQRLKEKEAMEEFMFLGLRKTAGVRRRDFESSFGVSLDGIYAGVIAKYSRLGLIEDDGESVRLTVRGMDAANEIMSNFLL